MNSDVVKFFIELATSIVQATDKVGLLGAAIAAIIAKITFKSNNFGRWSQLLFPSLDKYIVQAQAAKAANQELGVSATLAAGGVKLLNAALTMGVALLASLAIGLAIKGLDKLIKTTDELRDSAQEAIDTYSSSQSELSTMKSNIDDLASDYAKLSAGVDEFGNNVSLSTSEYERYNEIVNQIADMFPQMVRGYTEEGNAIIKNKGNVDALTEAYKALQAEASNTLLSKADDIIGNYQNTVQGSTWQWDTNIPDSIEAARELDKILREQDKYNFNEFDSAYRSSAQDKILGMLDKASISRESWEKNSEYVKRAVQEFPGIVQSIINTWESTVNTAVSNVTPLVRAYLDTSVDYAGLDSQQKAIIDSIVASFDEEFYNAFEGDSSKLFLALEKMMLNVKQADLSDEYTLTLNARTMLNNDEITVGDYKKQIEDFVTKLDNLQKQGYLDETDVKYIKLSLGFDEEGTNDQFDQMLNYAQSIVDEKAKDKVLQLNYSDLKIINDNNIKAPDGALLSWEQLQTAIKEAKAAAIGDFNTSNFIDYSEDIKRVSENIDAYREALEKLESGQFTIVDFTELIAKFPDLADGVDASSKSFNGLSKNLLKAIRNSPKDLVKDLEDLKEQLRDAGKSTDSVDQLINTMRNMPLETISELTNKYITLSDEINNATIAQNKLKEAMSENPNEGFETRGEAIETMKTLMEEGQIGSGSELWSIAEEFGFTYDGAKTINENADALAEYIKVRKKWYATNKDGEYDYKGTKSFLEYVDKKVKGTKFEDMFSYENGVLNFDIPNEQWEEFASLLGLTSEEFYDLMTQVAQFHEVNWENLDDGIAYLDKIAESTEEPKKKLQEFAEALQLIFGKNTKIDFTSGPIVTGKQMQEAGWSEVPEDSYTNIYSARMSNEEGTKTIVATPQLPNGDILTKESYKKYVGEMLESSDPVSYEFEFNGNKYTGEDILLETFYGEDSEEQAKKWGESFYESQQKFINMQDPLGIEVQLAQSGADSLSQIEEIKDSVSEGADGTVVIDSTSLTETLTEAGYTEEAIDSLMKKIEEYALITTPTDTDPLGLSGLMSDCNEAYAVLSSLGVEIEKYRQDGLWYINIDAKSMEQVLADAGYTQEQIQQYINEVSGSSLDGTIVKIDVDATDLDDASKTANEIDDGTTTEVTVSGKEDYVADMQEVIAASKDFPEELKTKVGLEPQPIVEDESKGGLVAAVERLFPDSEVEPVEVPVKVVPEVEPEMDVKLPTPEELSEYFNAKDTTKVPVEIEPVEVEPEVSVKLPTPEELIEMGYGNVEDPIEIPIEIEPMPEVISSTQIFDKYDSIIRWFNLLQTAIDGYNNSIKNGYSNSASTYVDGINDIISSMNEDDGKAFKNSAQLIVDGLSLLSSGELNTEDAVTISTVITNILTALSTSIDNTQLTGVGSTLASGIANGLTNEGWNTTAATVLSNIYTGLQTALTEGGYEGLSIDVKPALDPESTSAIEGYSFSNKSFDVNTNTSSILSGLRKIQNYSIRDKEYTVTEKRKIVGGGGGHYTEVNGTAHAQGTAFKGGDWRAKSTDKQSLVGELGPEILVRDGRWQTIGENGAEFTEVKKGDIIFNHKQTEDLLKNGYVTGRGKAFAEGTAYASGSSKYQTYVFSDTSKSKKDSSSKKSSKDDAKDVFDWFEVLLEEINEQLDLMNAKLENAVGISAKNSLLDQIINVNKSKLSTLKQGLDLYKNYANSLLEEIPSEYRKMAQDGAVAIEEFAGDADEKTLEAINNYREWAQKVADLTQQMEELNTEISTLAKQKIDNIAEGYENKKSLSDIKIDQYDAYNELLETDVGFESASIYQAMIDENNKNISILQKQRDAMQAELNKQVEAGNIKKYSQDWYDAVNDIAAVDTEIIELKTDTEDYQDAINELHWDKFDLLMDKLGAVSEEAENLIDILSNKDLVNKDTGEWTEEGITSLGLYAQQMEAAEVEAKKYEEEIKYLNKNWKKLGYTEQEYIEKLNELKSGQYDAIKAYEDTKNAIVDLNKERVDAIKNSIQKEIDAYEELINKKKEELNTEKD